MHSNPSDDVPNSESVPSSASGNSEGRLKEASEAMTNLLQLLNVDPEQATKEETGSRQAELLDYVPDKALDAVIAARKSTGEEGVSPLTFLDVVELVSSVPDPGPELGLVFDSMAHRLLVLSHPAKATPLSMLAKHGRSVHRYLVEGMRGEEAVMTFVLEHQDTLQNQFRSAPRISKVWRLQSATGEPTLEDLPPSPSPAAGPELVVQAQLNALKAKNIERAWEFAAPKNKAAVGPLGNFARLLEAPQFRPLLAHSHCSVLKRCMHTEDAYFELVAVTSDNTGLEGRPVSLVYLWDVRRQGSSNATLAGSWMTEGVQLISGAQVSRWPGTEST